MVRKAEQVLDELEVWMDRQLARQAASVARTLPDHRLDELLFHYTAMACPLAAAAIRCERARRRMSWDKRTAKAVYLEGR